MGELRRWFFFCFCLEPCSLSQWLFNPRLIHEVNEVLRPMDKLQWLILLSGRWLRQPLHLSVPGIILVATFFSDKMEGSTEITSFSTPPFPCGKTKVMLVFPCMAISYTSTRAWPQVLPKSSISSSTPSPSPACLRGEGAAYPLFFGQHVCLVWLPGFFFPWGKQNHRQGCSLRGIQALLCR